MDYHDTSAIQIKVETMDEEEPGSSFVGSEGSKDVPHTEVWLPTVKLEYDEHNVSISSELPNSNMKLEIKTESVENNDMDQNLKNDKFNNVSISENLQERKFAIDLNSVNIKTEPVEDNIKLLKEENSSLIGYGEESSALIGCYTEGWSEHTELDIKQDNFNEDLQSNVDEIADNLCENNQELTSNKPDVIKNKNCKKIATYECKKCLKKFVSAKNLTKHCSISCSHKCNMCEKVFKTRSFLRRHIFLCFNLQKEKKDCEICQEEFSTEYQLKYHHLSVHLKLKLNEKINFCDICKKGYVTKSRLRLHLIESHSPKIYRRNIKNTAYEPTEIEQSYQHHCKICNRRYMMKSRLQSHLIYCHSPKVYKKPVVYVTPEMEQTFQHECKICNRKFKYSQSLYKHMKSIHGEDIKPKCSTCKKGFQDLSKHKCNKFPNLNFKCIFCYKGFETSDVLKNHMSTHLGDVLFSGQMM